MAYPPRNGDSHNLGESGTNCDCPHFGGYRSLPLTVPRWVLPRTGYGGRDTLAGGFFFSSAITTSIAFSSCGSRPAITSAGVCSTSMSGGTPSFSTAPTASVVQPAAFGAVLHDGDQERICPL